MATLQATEPRATVRTTVAMQTRAATETPPAMGIPLAIAAVPTAILLATAIQIHTARQPDMGQETHRENHACLVTASSAEIVGSLRTGPLQEINTHNRIPLELAPIPRERPIPLRTAERLPAMRRKVPAVADGVSKRSNNTFRKSLIALPTSRCR